MITAVDTNVLLDAIENNPQFAAQSQEWIGIALSRGDVIICAVVYGELVPSFDSKADMDARLRSIGVALSPIDDAIAYEAGLRWQTISPIRWAAGAPSARFSDRRSRSGYPLILFLPETKDSTEATSLSYKGVLTGTPSGTFAIFLNSGSLRSQPSSIQ